MAPLRRCEVAGADQHTSHKTGTTQPSYANGPWQACVPGGPQLQGVDKGRIHARSRSNTGSSSWRRTYT
eukprot:SAG22_NODE_19219_length_277_cov_0.578652_1_plen_68_part_10